MEITKINNKLRNNRVLKIANISRPLEILYEKICVKIKSDDTNMTKYSNEKKPAIVVIIINQKVNPAVTATDLKRGDDNSNLDRVNESDQASL